MTEHVDTSWQVMLQLFPHDEVHSLVPKHSVLHPSLHTVPHVAPTSWHVSEQPFPVHPRKHWSPPEHSHAVPGSHPSFDLHATTAAVAATRVTLQAIGRSVSILQPAYYSRLGLDKSSFGDPRPVGPIGQPSQPRPRHRSSKMAGLPLYEPRAYSE
jgi:hypothetical protein